jgi:tetratricopeptide (TPR) repeat protein
MGKGQNRTSGHLHFFILCFLIIPILAFGCSDRNYIRTTLKEANDLYSQGDYQASLEKYKQIVEKDPKKRDRVLFEMGIIHANPGNRQKDYQLSLECFQRLVDDYPVSLYRKDSEMMIFNINNIIAKDKLIAAQQAQIKSLQKEGRDKGDRINALQEKIESFEKDIRKKNEEIAGRENEISALEKEISLIKQGPADKILIEKKDRRLTLLSRGNVIKAYKVALGTNPDGPKEMQGDNKTPEGTYIIDSRNRDSRYHMSLHISYPNEEDKRRAKRKGVSPGGDIMIHGLINDYAWIGNAHTSYDWTKGCIAVTDEEIEEIDKLVLDGTVVEIKP